MSTLKVNTIQEADGSAHAFGKVLQYVTTKRSSGSSFSTSSGSPQDFMTLNITTTGNSNKVLVLSNTFCRCRRYPGTEVYARVRLTRDSTTLVTDRQFGHEAYPNTSINALNVAFPHIYLDTPGNAGTYTYKIQFINDSGGNATVYGYDDSTITLLEIAA